MNYCQTKWRAFVCIILFSRFGSVSAHSVSPGSISQGQGDVAWGWRWAQAAWWGCASLEVLFCGGQSLQMQRFSCLGHCPTWVRAGGDPEPGDGSCLGRVLGGLNRSITSLICDRCAGGFAVRSAVKQRRILHPAPRTWGFVSSVAGIRPSLFAGTLGVYYFPHDESAKLPYKRCCSEVNLGRAHLLSAMCIEMRNLAPRIIISHGKY